MPEYVLSHNTVDVGGSTVNQVPGFTSDDVPRTAFSIRVPGVDSNSAAILLRDGSWRNGFGSVKGDCPSRDRVDEWIAAHGAEFRKQYLHQLVSTAQPAPSVTLPPAQHQPPMCGACQGDTRPARGGFVCDDCALLFDELTLVPRFLDPSAPVCGAPCGNSWHRTPPSTTPHSLFDCGTCLLPQGHAAMLHWTGCRNLAAGDAVPARDGDVSL